MPATKNAHNLAAYILRELGPVDTLKLQKLMYYCNGWSLAIRDKPIFRDVVQAWQHGPVVVSIYADHKLKASVQEWPQGNPDGLPKEDRAIADAVLKLYGARSGWALRNLTHTESPWTNAWERCGQGQRRHEVITEKEIGDFFKHLLASGKAAYS